MRIIITGCGSFLGRAAAGCLRQQGHELVLLRHSFEEEPGSLPDKADAWVHFAWAGIGSAGRSDPVIQEQNIRMAMAAFQKAAELGCGRFLFAGSQAEYGHGQDGSLKKEDGAAEPVSEYGKAKLEVLRQAQAAARGGQHWPEYIHMRLFSVYGPGDHATSLINTLIRGLEAGERIPLGPCTQSWNYLYITDAAKAIALLCEKGHAGVYNIAGSDTRVLSDFVREVQEILGGKGEVVFGVRPDNAEGPADLSPDISRIEALGFAQEVSFAEGIVKVSKEESRGSI